jgi:uncharacterized membrane protein YjjB (DUF3815 family)
MSLVETLVGVAVGSFLGFGFSLVVQNRILNLQKLEMLKQRVYSPLYDEVTEAIQRTVKGARPPTDEWDRVFKTEHLSYLIDEETLQHLKGFYGATSDTLNSSTSACTNHYSELVLTDLYERLSTTSNDTARTISQFVGFSLHVGIIPEQTIHYHSRPYNELRAVSPVRFIHETLAEYFQWWKEKAKSDKEIVEYLAARSRALREAEALREMLGAKLGVKPVPSTTSDVLSVGKQSFFERFFAKHKTTGFVASMVMGALLGNLSRFGVSPSLLFAMVLVPGLGVAILLVKTKRRKAIEQYKRVLGLGTVRIIQLFASGLIVASTTSLLSSPDWIGLLFASILIVPAIPAVYLIHLIREQWMP